MKGDEINKYLSQRSEMGRFSPSGDDREHPKKWMLDRIDAAIQRIIDGHAPRRIPADPTDVDLVLAEVRSWITGQGWPPFRISASPSESKRVFTGPGYLEQTGYIDAAPSDGGGRGERHE